MTGQELIDYIQEGKLQDKHFFIDVEGYLSPIQEVMELLITYFSRRFIYWQRRREIIM